MNDDEADAELARVLVDLYPHFGSDSDRMTTDNDEKRALLQQLADAVEEFGGTMTLATNGATEAATLQSHAKAVLMEIIQGENEHAVSAAQELLSWCGGLEDGERLVIADRLSKIATLSETSVRIKACRLMLREFPSTFLSVKDLPE